MREEVTDQPPSRDKDPRRGLPSVSELLSATERAGLIEEYGRELVTVHAREVLSGLRSSKSRAARALESGTLVESVADSLAGSERPIRRVINATGVFLHTNLGRAPLPAAVADSIAALVNAGCDLEVDLHSGRRGDRNARVSAALRGLTGAPAALVVNNNAAALVLALKTFALGKEVVVSRGELVEIGGSFRIPDILAGAGARLVEVGTTNRTRVADFQNAIGENTGLLLKVNPSNYRIRGFTEAPTTQQLVTLSRDRGVPLLVDEGSGVLRDRGEAPFDDHESIQTLLSFGCDLVCGSGDKVLGGSQAGLLLGREDLIEACHRSPLYRALRPSRLTLVTLVAVLERQRRGRSMPLDGLFVDRDLHRERLERWTQLLEKATASEGTRKPAVEIVLGDAYVGGGSAPDAAIEGWVAAIEMSQREAERLRLGDTPVMGRQHHGRLILDLRTVAPSDDQAVAQSVAGAMRPEGSTTVPHRQQATSTRSES